MNAISGIKAAISKGKKTYLDVFSTLNGVVSRSARFTLFAMTRREKL
jgi:hypothetical protein